MTAGTIQVADKRIVCQSCGKRYVLKERGQISEESAARAIGWSIWEGKTLGGKQQRRVYCPFDAGRVDLPEREIAKLTTWDAKCNTCDSTASEEWFEDLPLSQEDVKNWKSDHRCEPWVDLIEPKQAVAS